MPNRNHFLFTSCLKNLSDPTPPSSDTNTTTAALKKQNKFFICDSSSELQSHKCPVLALGLSKRDYSWRPSRCNVDTTPPGGDILQRLASGRIQLPWRLATVSLLPIAGKALEWLQGWSAATHRPSCVFAERSEEESSIFSCFLSSYFVFFSPFLGFFLLLRGSFSSFCCFLLFFLVGSFAEGWGNTGGPVFVAIR